MNRPTIDKFREQALTDAAVRAEHEALEPSYQLKRQMISLRKAAGLTQQQMAELLSTQKSNISRLESLGSGALPRLATVEAYAKAPGYSIRVEFEPRRDPV